MNILGIARRISSLPGLRRQTLSIFVKGAALLEGLSQADRRRRRRHRKPQPPKD